MAFNVFHDSNQGGVFVVCVLTAPLCILATILRFVMTKRTGRKIGWEDWFALLALIPYLFWVAYALYATIEQNGKNVFVPGALTPSQVTMLLQIGYTVNPFYPVNQTFAKLSLLVLYYRLFSIDDKFRYLTYGVGVVQILWFLATFWIRWFMCTPVRKLWLPATPGHCLNSNVLLAAGEPVNAFLDFVMVGMAMYMVTKLRLSSGNKAKLAFLFILGGFSGVVGFLRIGLAYNTVAKNSSDLVWIILQMATSIICCCAPIYRSILPEIPLLKSLTSAFRSTRASSNKSANSDNGHGIDPNMPVTRTIGSKPSKPIILKVGQSNDWLPLNSSAENHELSTHVWSNKDDVAYSSAELEAGGYPRQTVQIDQRVDHRV